MVKMTLCKLLQFCKPTVIGIRWNCLAASKSSLVTAQLNQKSRFRKSLHLLIFLQRNTGTKNKDSKRLELIKPKNVRRGAQGISDLGRMLLVVTGSNVGLTNRQSANEQSEATGGKNGEDCVIPTTTTPLLSIFPICFL